MKNRKQALRHFPRPYALFVLALTLMTLACWVYLWNGLSAYEKGVPHNVMSGLVASLQNEIETTGNCSSLLRKYGPGIPGSDAEIDGVIFAEAIRGQKVDFHKKINPDEPTKTNYELNAGNRVVANVELHVKKKGIFGLELYGIKSVYGDKKVTISAVPGVQVYVEGKLLAEDAQTQEEFIPKDLRELAGFSKSTIKIPQFDTYELLGLFHIPYIAGYDEKGNISDAVFVRDDHAVVGLPMPEELQKEMEERAATITKKYSYYMSDNLVWGGFRSYIVKNAPVYDRLRTLEVYWYTLHDSTRFENMEMSDWVMYSDKLLSLRVVYDFIVVGQGKVTTYPTDLTYYLAQEADGVWRIAEMIVN